jgi:4-amino-4-deoxy-L-arabinose transferase-like glycosyltransferase
VNSFSTDSRRLALIILAGLLARLVAAAALGGGFHFADETQYVDAARRLLSGDGFDPDYRRVPGYPALLAALGGVSPDSVLWLRLSQAALTATGVAFTFLLGDRLVGRTAGFAAAAVYALDPLLVVSAALLYPEAAAALILAGVALAAWESAQRDSKSWAATAGALLGLLALFRPVALALVPVTAIWIAWVAPAPTPRRLIHAALVTLACLLMLGPWTYRNYQLHGRLIPVSLVGTRTAGISRAESQAQGVTGPLLGRASEDPAGFAKRVGREFAHFWELTPQRLVTDNPKRREALHRANPRLPTTAFAPKSLRNVVAGMASGIELLLAVVGLAVLWRSRRREAVLLGSLILVYALGHALFSGKMRYRITVLPLLFVLAGAGIAWLQAALFRRQPSGS